MKVVVISDMHCGSRAGLASKPANDTQETLLAEYTKMVSAWKSPDVLVCNGDLIDGKGAKNRAVDQTENDRLKQAKDATELISMWCARRVILLYGTDFHTQGEGGEDFETVIANDLSCDIHDRIDCLEIGGVKFNIRHFVPASTVPHGRHTSLGMDNLWNEVNASRGKETRADVIIRSHVHYHAYSGGNGWLACTTPALMARGCKYGSRRCRGDVDFGVMRFDCARGRWDMETIIKRIDDASAGKIKI